MSFLCRSAFVFALVVVAGQGLRAQQTTVSVTNFPKTHNIYTNLNEQFPNTGAGTPGTNAGVPNASIFFDPATFSSKRSLPNGDRANNGIIFKLTSNGTGQDFWDGSGPLTVPVNLTGASNVYLLVAAHRYVTNIGNANVTVTFNATDGSSETFTDAIVPFFYYTSGYTLDQSEAKNGSAVPNLFEQTVVSVNDVGGGGTANSATGVVADYELTELTFNLDPSFAAKSLASMKFYDSDGQSFLLGVTVTGTALISQAPFGSLDTPVSGATVNGAVGFTGWALSSPAVTTVGIYREPVKGETGTALVFIGDAVFTAGARPDIQSEFPAYPNNSTGYGLQILTNELPNSDGSGGLGNGTYRFHAVVVSADGISADVAANTITVDNSKSVLPFGTIDTPAQGGTVSGSSYVNFGWVLTPPPNMIPIDGSTITVYIDGKAVGHPVYNNYRSDIANTFPGLANTAGAVGYYRIDTTKLADGGHKISWVATDSGGNAAGLGSRFFTVQN